MQRVGGQRFSADDAGQARPGDNLNVVSQDLEIQNSRVVREVLHQGATAGHVDGLQPSTDS
jgi:hypothetical protein